MLSPMLIRRGKLSINIYIQPPDRIGTNDNRLSEIRFPQQNYIAVVATWSHDIVKLLFLSCLNVKQFHRDPRASHGIPVVKSINFYALRYINELLLEITKIWYFITCLAMILPFFVIHGSSWAISFKSLPAISFQYKTKVEQLSMVEKGSFRERMHIALHLQRSSVHPFPCIWMKRMHSHCFCCKYFRLYVKRVLQDQMQETPKLAKSLDTVLPVLYISFHFLSERAITCSLMH